MFLFYQFSTFGVKLFTKNSREFFKFESVRRDLVLLLINFMDENAYSHVYVVPKRQNSEGISLVLENFRSV